MTAGGNNEASDASNRHFNVKRASYGSNNVNFNASVGNITVNQGCCKCQESKINLTRSSSTQSVQSEQNAKVSSPPRLTQANLEKLQELEGTTKGLKSPPPEKPEEDSKMSSSKGLKSPSPGKPEEASKVSSSKGLKSPPPEKPEEDPKPV